VGSWNTSSLLRQRVGQVRQLLDHLPEAGERALGPLRFSRFGFWLGLLCLLFGQGFALAFPPLPGLTIELLVGFGVLPPQRFDVGFVLLLGDELALDGSSESAGALLNTPTL